jgi:hypothetical protein
MGADENGNGSLTREVLRAELRAGLAEQTVAIRREMDERFAPVNAHIARIDRGEFTAAQKAGILKTVQESRDAGLTRQSLRAPIIGLGLALLTLGMMIVSTLVAAGVIGGS